MTKIHACIQMISSDIFENEKATELNESETHVYAIQLHLDEFRFSSFL